MEAIIEQYKDIIIQIATPYCTGTGFYSSELGVIVTNEHVVRDNKEVVVDGTRFEKQLVKVLFTDPKYDLAFLALPFGASLPETVLETEKELLPNDYILVIGEPFGLKYMARKGQVITTNYSIDDVDYIEHDAELHPINSGGPMVNEVGAIVAVNTFILKDGLNEGFSLPAKFLKEVFADYQTGNGKTGCRCYVCSALVFDDNPKKNICPSCKNKIDIPALAVEYKSVGIAHTVEELLIENGYQIALARRGPNNWEIHQGSAFINISYYEKSGLIIGDAYLCSLPTENIQPLYEYLLRQNHEIESLTFSVKGNDVVLSLMIYDRYLNDDTGRNLLKQLFEAADDYDNILIEKYGGTWKVRND